MQTLCHGFDSSFVIFIIANITLLAVKPLKRQEMAHQGLLLHPGLKIECLNSSQILFNKDNQTIILQHRARKEQTQNQITSLSHQLSSYE